MKKIKINIKLYGILIALFFVLSCNDEFLKEKPKSFLSPENAYVDKEGFDAGLVAIHRIVHGLFTWRISWLELGFTDQKDQVSLTGQGTDLGWYWDKVNFFGDYSLVNPDNRYVSDIWKLLYFIIKDANVIITRAENESVQWNSDEEKNAVVAEARFFRAFAYRYLVYHFGGVPVIDKEITGIKLDFERSSKSEVLEFIKSDLEFASLHLPTSNANNGRIFKAAADHLLAETCIALGEYDEAIAAATAVIDDPQYELMQERFGSFKDKPGDVFWDLFRLGNQNSHENTEVIWAIQIEYNVPGGSASHLERCWGPLISNLKTPDNKQALLDDEFRGRPIGFIRPSVYLEYDIWISDWDNDMRNSEYNMQREFLINNPESEYYGQVYQPSGNDTVRNHFVYIKKASHPYGHPQGYDVNGNLYSDIYVFRLAETYLLRAEAYMMKGDGLNAAADINVVRSRANATPIDPGMVDIHYILDERARELVIEEPRRLTLYRTGLLEDRVKKHNPVSAPSVKGRDNILPIPQSEIDANLEVELTQNQGY